MKWTTAYKDQCPKCHYSGKKGKNQLHDQCKTQNTTHIKENEIVDMHCYYYWFSILWRSLDFVFINCSFFYSSHLMFHYQNTMKILKYGEISPRLKNTGKILTAQYSNTVNHKYCDVRSNASAFSDCYFCATAIYWIINNKQWHFSSMSTLVLNLNATSLSTQVVTG